MKDQWDIQVEEFCNTLDADPFFADNIESLLASIPEDQVIEPEMYCQQPVIC